MGYGCRKTGTNSEKVIRGGLFIWKRIGEEKERGKDGERKCQEMENRIRRYLKCVIVVVQGTCQAALHFITASTVGQETCCSDHTTGVKPASMQEVVDAFPCWQEYSQNRWLEHRGITESIPISRLRAS